MSAPHEPSDACYGRHCFSCGVDDEPDSGYIVCGECFHVYRTAGELRRAYRREFWRLHRNPFDYSDGPLMWEILWRMLTIRARDINFCQHCIHDF